MRVVYVTPGAALGGAERSLLDVIAATSAVLPELRPALILGEEGPLAVAARRAGVDTQIVRLPQDLAGVGDAGLREGGWAARKALARRAPRAAWGALSFARALRRALRSFAPDLVHSNALKIHAVTPWLAQSAPVVWHLRDYVGDRAVARHVLRPAARFAAAGLAISHSLADDARRVFPRLPMHVVYNAIDTDAFCPPGPDAPALDLDALAGLPPAEAGVVRVGLVATYGRWKGQDCFLDALARLSRDLPWRAFVIGGPIYRTRGSQWSLDELRERARALGVADRLGFVPFQSDPAQAFRALDVVVHASTRPEPFGRTIVEAMSTERAVIAAASGGAAELFTDGVEALGFTSGDANDLASGLRRLVADADLRARLGQAGRAHALARFARARLGADVARIYGEIVG